MTDTEVQKLKAQALAETRILPDDSRIVSLASDGMVIKCFQAKRRDKWEASEISWPREVGRDVESAKHFALVLAALIEIAKEWDKEASE